MKRQLLITAVVASLFSASVLAGFGEGLAAYKSGNYAKALKEWKPLAEKGDAKAQYALGAIYGDGEDVPKDAQQAVFWYRKAAEQGYADAQPAPEHDFNKSSVSDNPKCASVITRPYPQKNVSDNPTLSTSSVSDNPITSDAISCR